MGNLRNMVLRNFKNLHRTRMKLFAGDEKALIAARIKIKEEFIKNKNVTNEESIKALIKFGEDVEEELRTRVIQAREVKPGIFEAKITQDTLKLDNIAFNENAIPENSVATPCCQRKEKKEET